MFVSWLTGKHSQPEIDGTRTGRTFRRRTAWCWSMQPTLPPCKTIFHAVMVDGIWIGSWCLLIALSDTGRVLAWQWSGGETTAAWSALFEQIPSPGVLVSDGGSGLPSALRQTWSHTKHQRCLFHLQLNVTRHLTRNPRTRAGRALRQLVLQLSQVWDEDAAILWQIRLDEWWRTFGHLTRERTLLRNGRFGYTHDRLRKAWLLVRNVVPRVRRCCASRKADGSPAPAAPTDPTERTGPSTPKTLSTATWTLPGHKRALAPQGRRPPTGIYSSRP